MDFRPTDIPEVIFIEPTMFNDDRGFFMETYQEEKYAQYGIPRHFMQDNHSGSKRGVLRGLHYQIKQSQGKLVWVVEGEIFDVAVDLRRSSPSFGKSACVVLSAKKKTQLWIPEGFAHGFYVLSDWAEIVYKTTTLFAREYERTLLWNDPVLGIEWPLVDGKDPHLSDKDKQGLPLAKAEVFD